MRMSEALTPFYRELYNLSEQSNTTQEMRHALALLGGMLGDVYEIKIQVKSVSTTVDLCFTINNSGS